MAWLAYTYNEPSIFIEFARDCGIEAHKNGIFNIFVSNGYVTRESVSMMSKFLDCITIDFKGSGKQEFVRRYIGIPNADPIFLSLKDIRDRTSIHTEIADLIVPQVGDDLEAARKLCKLVYDELGPDTPIHFLRFHPDYKMMEFGMTPIETLEKHHSIAKEVGLRYAYIGNVPGHPLEHTYCPECKDIAVQRYGFSIESWNLDANNCCKNCGYPISIIGKLNKQHGKNRFQLIQ
jgi:pyruvate formate lyase activating enzyme